VDGPAAALSVVDGLDLDEYQPYHAVRADLLRRLGRTDEAVAAYDRAIARTANRAERTFLSQIRSGLVMSPGRGSSPVSS
jgi:RNA polymerase sigma-70 factor (ECF subfamily)